MTQQTMTKRTAALVPWQWSDELPTSRHGEGVSRPQSGIKTREYRVLVFKPGSQPMTWITRAESPRHAIRYAQARWPGAEVEVA
jgi:hypothetical protein